MNLLLVEDNEADACLVRTGFEIANPKHRLHVVGDGVEAMSFLQRQQPFTDAPIPKLILVDLNMPRMDGREFIQAVRSDLRLRTVPVVVLTTSDSATDVDLCYRLGANSFVTKPTDITQFFDLIQSIESFWLRFAQSPELT